MALFIRMILYPIFSALAVEGLVLFDAATGSVTFKIDDIILVIVGIVGYLGTFVAGRWAKAKGGLT